MGTAVVIIGDSDGECGALSESFCSSGIEAHHIPSVRRLEVSSEPPLALLVSVRPAGLQELVQLQTWLRTSPVPVFFRDSETAAAWQPISGAVLDFSPDALLRALGEEPPSSESPPDRVELSEGWVDLRRGEVHRCGSTTPLSTQETELLRY